MRRFAILCLFVSGLTPLASAATWYVAPDGRDAWSGRRPAANADQTDGPFATLARARDAARAARRQGADGPFVVEVRGGLYELKTPLALGPEDSDVTYRAYAGEHPLLSAGRVITGFRPASLNGKRCWSARLPAGWSFGQLFVKRRGERYFQRRYRPTKGMLTVAGFTYSPARKAMRHRAAQPDFKFFKGDFQLWENLSDVEVVALHSWSASRLYIERLDLARSVVRFTSVPTFRIGCWYRGGRNPYFLENVKECFGKPGRWYLDRPTATLYYAPLPGETPENVTVVAPRLGRLVVVAGDPKRKRFVERVRFEGIAFAFAAWSPPRKGYDVSQGQPKLPAAIEFSWARDCALRRCTAAHVGAYAIALGRGCSRCRVVGCRLFDLGGGGVKVGDCRMNRRAAYPELPTDNAVENNLIAGGGLINFSANAVWTGIVKGLAVRHNEIRGFPYTGLALGWCWGYAATSAADNRIEYNHIHRVMQLIQDGGGIYTLGQQPGTVIRGNVIHDCRQSPFACGAGQRGIYLDEGSGPFLIENNLVYNVQMGEFNLHFGRGNVVRNNIFAFAAGDPITAARREKHLSLTFERNIVYQTGRQMLSGRYDPGRPRTVFDYNLYYSTSGKPPLFGRRTFEKWRATGRDAHSLIADPRFVNPQKYDFRLGADSPALKLGFKPFDPSRAGLEPAFRDVDDPELPIARPPVYAMKRLPTPPLALGFHIDCEDIPLGMTPREFYCAGRVKGRGDFVVTDETACRGKKCLKGYEKGGLRKPFYPYLIYRFRGQVVKQGRIAFSFSFRNSRERPAYVAVEIRDYANRGRREFLTGPVVFFGRSGAIAAGRRRVAVVPNGEWIRVEISFALGENAPKTFRTAVTTRGGQTYSTTQPFLHRGFAAATWLGIISNGAEPAEFYLDDLTLRVSK